MLTRALLRPVLRFGAPSANLTRSIPRSFSRSAPRSHTSDSYSKDVDSSPSADSKIHRVDPSSENVQKPHEPPSGPWSATGVDAGVKNAQGKAEGKPSNEGEKATGMKEYSTMSGERPYHAQGENEGSSGKAPYQHQRGQNPSGTGEGPAGSQSGGRKPEGR
ncbi:hypothetical protein C8R44DRAFT_848176 [Mycena epipterygia]|nr:hypothetical protein C8R44DRAFT_848176 [Mycena epipterygia]